MAALKLYAESTFMSPWVFHALVALEEKQLPYDLEVVQVPMTPDKKRELQERSILGKVPILVDGMRGSASRRRSRYLATDRRIATSPPPRSDTHASTTRC